MTTATAATEFSLTIQAVPTEIYERVVLISILSWLDISFPDAIIWKTVVFEIDNITRIPTAGAESFPNIDVGTFIESLILFRHYRILDLFRTPNLRKKSCLIIFNSFCNYAVYSGLNFFVPHLGGKDHINFLYGALIELPAYPAMYLTLNRLGRRFLLMSSMMIGGSFLIATALVPETEHLIVILLFLTSKFFMTFAFFITDLMASELFPTVLRGAGASLTQTVSTVGLCLSPLIAHLGSYGLWMPLVIFGVLGIVGGMATILLPETLNQNLPETLEEAEEFGKNMTWRDYLHFCGSSSSGNAPSDKCWNEREWWWENGGQWDAETSGSRLKDYFPAETKLKRIKSFVWFFYWCGKCNKFRISLDNLSGGGLYFGKRWSTITVYPM